MSPEMKVLGDGLIRAIKEHVEQKTAPLIARIEMQNQRISALSKQLAALQRKFGS